MLFVVDWVGFVFGCYLACLRRLAYLNPPPRSSVLRLLLQILVALFLFDTDADGKLTFTEVTMYIASVLRVMHAVSEGVSGDCPLVKAVSAQSVLTSS